MLLLILACLPSTRKCPIFHNMKSLVQSSLTARQARFIEEFLVDANGTQAAIRAGTAPAGAHVWASRALRDPKVAMELKRRQEGVATRLSIQRENVLNGLVEAVDMAREQRNPMGMIRGWSELARMLGLYEPEVRRLELGVSQKGTLQRMEAMSDQQLLTLIGQGTVAA